MKRTFENARVTVEVPEEEGPVTSQPLLFSVADLETALTELHYWEAHKIASRVCKSLVPYDTGLYTREELDQAQKDAFGYILSTLSDRVFEQVRKNRLKRSHES